MFFFPHYVCILLKSNDNKMADISFDETIYTDGCDINMDIWFDETIFTNGFSIKDYDTIIVSNKADKYLVERLGKTACMGTENSIKCESTIINLNPRVPCKDINIFTINKSNKQVLETVSFNQISVIDADVNVTRIDFGEHKEGNIYTVGTLNSIESAIMIKYFAINAPIFITKHLYHFIHKQFKDKRQWFLFNTDINGKIQNSRGELTDNNEIIELLNLSYTGPSVNLY